MPFDNCRFGPHPARLDPHEALPAGHLVEAADDALVGDLEPAERSRPVRSRFTPRSRCSFIDRAELLGLGRVLQVVQGSVQAPLCLPQHAPLLAVQHGRLLRSGRPPDADSGPGRGSATLRGDSVCRRPTGPFPGEIVDSERCTSTIVESVPCRPKRLDSHYHVWLLRSGRIFRMPPRRFENRTTAHKRGQRHMPVSSDRPVRACEECPPAARSRRRPRSWSLIAKAVAVAVGVPPMKVRAALRACSRARTAGPTTPAAGSTR